MELAKTLRARESNDPSQDHEEDKKMDRDLVHKKKYYKNHIKNILKSVVGKLNSAYNEKNMQRFSFIIGSFLLRVMYL